MPLLFSSPAGAQRTRSAVLLALVAWLMIFIGSVVFAKYTLGPSKSHGSASLIGRPMGRDFSNIFAGAICLVQDCSPYRFEAVHGALEQHGYFYLPAEEWSALLPLYPPPTLALFTPLTGLSFKTASRLFYLLSMTVCALVCFRLVIASPVMARISPLARGFFLMCLLLSSAPRWATHDGNPVILCTGLLLYCCFDEALAETWLPAFCFAAAVLLKPQVALPFMFPLWLKPTGGRKMVLRGYGLIFLVVVPTLIWCALHPQLSHWATDLHANLTLGADPIDDMGPFQMDTAMNPRLNLNYLLGYWIHNERLDQVLTAAILLSCLTILIVGLRRIGQKVSIRKYKLAVALTAALTLLLTYHRAYDAVLLLAAIPWIVEALESHTQRAFAWTALLTIYLDLVVWAWYLPVRFLGDAGQQASLQFFVVNRFHAILGFFLTLLFCYLLLKETSRPSPERARSELPA